MRFVIYPYKMESGSSKELAKSLGAHRVYGNKKYVPKANDFIINWGNNEYPNWNDDAIGKDLWYLNHPSRVAVATDKLQSFNILKDQSVKIPKFTTSRSEAEGWGCPVLARTVLRGHGGVGCELIGFGEKDTITFGDPKIRLYTQYIKKTAEYRVHIFSGEVWDVQEKRKRTDVEKENMDFQVRNFNNGWVFCRDNIDAPQEVLEQAARAVDALELDFGAVDIVYNRKLGAFVLEVNTAPGIEGTTITRYMEAFQDYEAAM